MSLKLKKIILFFTFSLLFTALFTTTAFAGISNDLNQVAGATGEQARFVWDILKAIVGPVGGAIFSINGLKLLLGGEKAMEEAKKRAIIIIVVFICVFGAGVIIKEIGGWFPTAIPDVDIALK